MRKIEMGSGFAPTDGFEHADLNPNAPHVEHVIDVAGPLPFEDGTFDEIRAVDIVEHVSYRSTGEVLDEWARVLAPGGRLFVQTPDALSMIQWYLECPAKLVRPEFADRPPIVSLAWRLLGGHADDEYVEHGGDFRLNAHFALFDREALGWYLERAGLRVESITRNAHPNLSAWAYKP